MQHTRREKIELTIALVCAAIVAVLSVIMVRGM